MDIRALFPILIRRRYPVKEERSTKCCCYCSSTSCSNSIASLSAAARGLHLQLPTNYYYSCCCFFCLLVLLPSALTLFRQAEWIGGNG
ncbi:hypothetical protein TB2_002256 [Malus domestica]